MPPGKLRRVASGATVPVEVLHEGVGMSAGIGGGNAVISVRGAGSDRA